MIKNKLKLGMFALAMLLVLGVASQASAAPLTWSADQNIDLSSPDVNLIIHSGSKANSLVVGTGSITVVVATGDTFTVSSADRELNVSGNVTSGVSNTCTSGVSTVVINGAGETIVVSPSGTSGSCDGGGGGGGSSSGSSSNNNNNNNNNNNEPTTAEGCGAGNLFSTTTGKACGTVIVGCGSGNAFSPITGQSCGSTNTNTTVFVNGSIGAFNYDFGLVTVKFGSSGAFCRAWQNFFNNRMNAGLVIDGLCGPKTMAAARIWQASAGLVADGLLGPKSRAAAYAQAAAEVR